MLVKVRTRSSCDAVCKMVNCWGVMWSVWEGRFGGRDLWACRMELCMLGKLNRDFFFFVGFVL